MLVAPAVSGTEGVSCGYGGGHIMPVALAVIGTERVSCGHIRPVAPAIGGTEMVRGGHIRPVALAVGGRRGYKLGMERVGSAPVTSVNGLCRNPDITW